jgi:mannosyltransferase OCH1-like enzyme
LIHQNPEFEYRFFDDNDCRNYIIQHFPKEVLFAYDSLIPGAFKADLWRYCVLFKEGGVYLDIKLYGINGFKLIDYIEKDIEKDYFVFDIVIPNHLDLLCIYNAFMMSHPNNPLFYDCIKQIVENVKNKYYGFFSLSPTGPLLLGKIYKMRKNLQQSNFEQHFDFKLKGTCSLLNKENKQILNHYSEYREEQKKTQTKHYSVLWNERNIYK